MTNRATVRGYTVVLRYKTAAQLGLTEKALREQTLLAMEIWDELRSDQCKDRAK